MAFNCNLCRKATDLSSLADLSCSCLVCTSCSRVSIERQLLRSDWVPSPSPPPPPKACCPTQIEIGDDVLYRAADGSLVEASVEMIDITVQPPQYGIQLLGADNLRWTEAERLFCCNRGANARTPAPKHRQPPKHARQQNPSPLHHESPGQPLLRLSAQCACCAAPVTPSVVRTLAPEAVATWEAERTASWLRVHDVIACPYPGCGALIQRVPTAAAAAAAAPDAAALHREQHRYRCGACGRDFCDSCLARPYHNGMTCRQARAPDCLLCGGKVEEERLQQLLPSAAAASAAGGGGGGGLRRSARLRASSASAGAGASQAGRSAAGPSGSSAAAGGGGGGGPEEETLAVVQCASNSELRTALKVQLEVDMAWCLERQELERAFLHWGCHTCGSAECAAKLRAMCTRPLPCGHWCCGLRGEGEAAGRGASGSAAAAAHSHPRCVQCGAGSSSAAACGGAAILSDCCFCWEPLSSAPCVEMACGPRHMCHLQCALARLAAGYPGPHISFTHLYCPLCRTAGGAGAGPGGGGSSLQVQTALGPVHLDHPALSAALQPHLELRDQVVAAVRARLRMDPALKAEPELRPGGRYDGRPADFGLERLLFYKCSKCAKPYYGGQRACGAAAAAEPAQEQQQPSPAGGRRRGGGGGAGGAAAAGAGGAAAGGAGGAGGADPQQQLVCGECCARSCGANCPRHGTAYIEWKCKYCCSLASWFCFGTTHFCEPCHKLAAQGQRFPHVAANSGTTCTDPRCGLKDTPHPPPGQEACLGCGMCRAGL